MKRRMFTLAAAIVIALITAGVWRAWTARQTAPTAPSAAASGAAETTLELAAEDVLTAQKHTLPLSAPISGALRALQTAVIKARAAGELQGLLVREGDSVLAGQEIAHIDITEARARLRQAQQQADAAKAQVDINQRQFANNQALVEQGFISNTALVTSQASLQAAESTYQAAVAAVDLARKSQEDTVLRSPIKGQVSQRLAQPGERVAVDTKVLEVMDISRLELEAQLSPLEAQAVRVGQTARLVVEGAWAPLLATVARINPSAQAGSRSVPVYLVVEQTLANTVLRPGQFVQGTLDTGSTEALAVPLEAVRTDKPRPYLQVLEQGRIVHRAVTTGVRASLNEQTLIAVEGVPEGAQILAGRVSTLREGTAVRIATSAPPAPKPASSTYR